MSCNVDRRALHDFPPARDATANADLGFPVLCSPRGPPKIRFQDSARIARAQPQPQENCLTDTGRYVRFRLAKAARHAAAFTGRLMTWQTLAPRVRHKTSLSYSQNSCHNPNLKSWWKSPSNSMRTISYVSLLSSDEESDYEVDSGVWTGPFRFLDLPAELRVGVYHCLLPAGLTISFTIKSYLDNWWYVWGMPKHTEGTVSRHGSRKMRLGEASPQEHNCTSLFLVSKFVSAEARGKTPCSSMCHDPINTRPAVLYGENTFQLMVDGLPHKPISIASPLIFGPLGEPNRLHLLRNLRSVELVVSLDDNNNWVVKRHRGRLDHFVQIIKQHADDINQKSLLKYFKVRVEFFLETEAPFSTAYTWYRRPAKNVEKFMFGLESLAVLRGIEEVEVAGVPEWYAKCLELCIQGKGGDVEEINYPLVEIKRTKGWGGPKRKVWVSTKKWYQPALNWKEFAERNGIGVPEDIERFWMEDS